MTAAESPPICPICNRRPVAGYVAGPGVYLERTCYQCWKANPDSRERYQRNASTIGAKGGAKS